MKGFASYFQKEILELVRTGRLLLFTIIFVLFGIMNPAIAKLTPWLYETMADSLESAGLVVGEYTVTAMDSWTQFVKNIPMALIVTMVMFSSMFTNEYAKGTLVPLLTKGLSRVSVAAAKTAAMLLVWSGGFLLCFGITYGYTAYYWDNSVVSNLGFAVFGWWLMGVFLICAAVFFSSFANAAGQVLLGTGGICAAMYLLGLVGKIREWLPTYMTESVPLLTGQADPCDYCHSLSVTAAVSLLFLAVSLPVMQKRKL